MISEHGSTAETFLERAAWLGATAASSSALFVTDSDAVDAVFENELAKLPEFDQYAVGRQLARCLERMLLIPLNATCEVLPGCVVEHVVISGER